MKTTKREIQSLVRALIKKYDGNNEAAAGELGVSTVSLWRWEKGRSIPHNTFIRQMRELVNGKE